MGQDLHRAREVDIGDLAALDGGVGGGVKRALRGIRHSVCALRTTPKVAKSVAEARSQVKLGPRSIVGSGTGPFNPRPAPTPRSTEPARAFFRGGLWLEVEGVLVSTELVGQVGTREGELDGRLEEPELVAGVVARALEFDGVHRATPPQSPQSVGQLDLAATIRRRLAEDREKLGRQDVPPDDGQVGRRLLGSGLLDQVEDLVHAALDRPGGDHSVLMDALAWDALDRDHRSLIPLGHVEQLPHAWRRSGADDVVAEEHGEGLVADQRAGAEDGMAEPKRLLLADVGDGGELRDGLDLGELLRLAPIVEVVLELEGRVEVILDRALAPPGHDDDLG